MPHTSDSAVFKQENYLKNVKYSTRVSWWHDMRNAIRMIRDVERQANEILDHATSQAEIIVQQTEDTLLSVYRKAYEEAIAEAHQRSAELVEESKKKAESVIENILDASKRQIERDHSITKEKFESAVEAVFQEITSWGT